LCAQGETLGGGFSIRKRRHRQRIKKGWRQKSSHKQKKIKKESFSIAKKGELYVGRGGRRLLSEKARSRKGQPGSRELLGFERG